MRISGKKNLKCSICGNTFEAVDNFFTRRRLPACRECSSEEKRYSSVLMRIIPDGFDVIHFSEHFNFFESNISTFPHPVVSVKVSKENKMGLVEKRRGWRFKKGYKIIESGYFGSPVAGEEGCWDINSRLHIMENKFFSSPVEIYWVFGKEKKSNFIDTALYTRKEFEIDACRWFERHKFSLQCTLYALMT